MSRLTNGKPGVTVTVIDTVFTRIFQSILHSCAATPAKGVCIFSVYVLLCAAAIWTFAAQASAQFDESGLLTSYDQVEAAATTINLRLAGAQND